MSAKNSVVFSILLLFSFSTFVTINSSEESITTRESIYSSLRNINNEEETKERVADIEELQRSIQANLDRPYPLLNDMFHPKITLFRRAANQLTTGNFKPGFHRGMLFYGPPGVGKTAMVKAMANESDCKLFKISTSQLFNPEDGADVVTKIFSQAKKIEKHKGIIIFFDSLGSFTPRIIDAKIWAEFDDCSETHSNILIVAASNACNVVDKCLRERFKCIKFSCPDPYTTYKILKNKAQHFRVPLSEPELQYHARRMKGLSGKRVTDFIQDVSEHINENTSLERSINLAIEGQADNGGEANQKGFTNIFNQLEKLGWAVAGSLITTAVSTGTQKGISFLFDNSTTNANPVNQATNDELNLSKEFSNIHFATTILFKLLKAYNLKK